MRPQFFIDLLNVLREYKEEEFTKTDITKVFQQFVDNGHVDSKELIELTGKPFYSFYADVMGVVRNLNEKKVEEEVVKVKQDFVDTFSGGATMPKKQCAELCGRSEPWLYTVKDNFEQSRKGVVVVSFLRWLKVYDFNAYNLFKTNYEK